MPTIIRTFEVSCAHRLEKVMPCNRMHGHNYKFEVMLTAYELNADGMVMDFSEFKYIVEDILNVIDHKYIVSIENVKETCPYYSHGPREHMAVLDIPSSTVEHLAMWFVRELKASLKSRRHGLSVAVRIWETSKCCAEYVELV